MRSTCITETILGTYWVTYCWNVYNQLWNFQKNRNFHGGWGSSHMFTDLTILARIQNSMKLDYQESVNFTRITTKFSHSLFIMSVWSHKKWNVHNWTPKVFVQQAKKLFMFRDKWMIINRIRLIIMFTFFLFFFLSPPLPKTFIFYTILGYPINWES